MEPRATALHAGEQITHRERPGEQPRVAQAAVTLRIARTLIRIEALTGPTPTPFIDRRLAPFLAPHGHPELILEATFAEASEPFTPSSVIRSRAIEGGLDFTAPQFRLSLTLAPDAPTRARVLCTGSYEQLLGALRLALAHHLVHAGRGYLLHASSVLVGDTVHLFPGPSGTGKSTAAANAPGTILGDEITAVTIDADGVFVSGTPFGNRLQPSALESGRVVIHRIVHAPVNESLPIPDGEVISLLLVSMVFSPSGDDGGPQILTLLGETLAGCARDTLRLRADDSFWRKEGKHWT